MERNVRTASDRARQPLARRLDATEDDLARGRDAAYAIAVEVLGHDPGPLRTAASMSHYVYVGADIVVKLVNADGHTRLDREIALAPHLPTGLSAPLLGSGRFETHACGLRYACFARMPGTTPGMDLPGIDAATARRWTGQAVRRLHELHTWTPTGDAEQVLRESPVEEGFVSRHLLVAEIERLVAADRDGVVPRHLIEGLTEIARRAPEHARADMPIHADCFWDNWLTDADGVTALLDFEHARLGEPADDWFFLAVTSGPHLDVVVDAIAEETALSSDILRDTFEPRDATFLAQDLRVALEQPTASTWMAQRFNDLEELVVGRRWRRHRP